MVERNVARPISLVLFPLADKRYTLCDVPNDRSLDFDRLDLYQYRRCGREQIRQYLFGVIESRIPLLQACSDKSSTSECVMAWILRCGECCGQ